MNRHAVYDLTRSLLLYRTGCDPSPDPGSTSCTLWPPGPRIYRRSPVGAPWKDQGLRCPGSPPSTRHWRGDKPWGRGLDPSESKSTETECHQ